MISDQAVGQGLLVDKRRTPSDEWMKGGPAAARLSAHEQGHHKLLSKGQNKHMLRTKRKSTRQGRKWISMGPALAAHALGRSIVSRKNHRSESSDLAAVRAAVRKFHPALGIYETI